MMRLWFMYILGNVIMIMPNATLIDINSLEIVLFLLSHV